MSDRKPQRRWRGWWLIGGSLAALAGGIVAGAWAQTSRSPLAAQLMAVMTPVGAVWVDALRMTVLPLVVTQLVAAIASARGRAVGRLGLLSVLVFLTLLLVAGLFTLAAAPTLIRYFAPGPGALAGFQAPQAAAPVRPAPEGASDWLAGLVPTNVLEAASNDDLLPVIVFSVLFALALTRIRPEGRDAVLAVSRGIAEAMLVLVGWIMAVAPIGVFALALQLGAARGLETVRVLASFVVIVCALLTAFTMLMYLIAVLVGRVPLGRFSRAILPAQIVAVSTRSSIAALPALLEGAERDLQLRPSVSGFVLPLAVSAFKVNRTVSSTAKLLFLAYLYNVDLSAVQIGSFFVAVLIMSFSAVGVPNGGSAFKTLPFYVAAGIPVAGVVILEAVEDIPDIFKTATNVTGNMTAAAIVARLAPEGDVVFQREAAAVATPATAL